MDLSVIVDHYPKLITGAVTTLKLVGLSCFLGAVFALPLAFARLSAVKWLRSAAYGYIFFFRGTPLLVQIFLIYYGAAQFEWVRESFLWVVLSKPYWCAIIAFSMNTTAYTSEILRGALQSIPKGEVEACEVLGMGRFKMFQRVLLPRAFGIMLPAYSNEVVLMLKGSALASTITLMDLMGAARTIIARTYTPMEIFISAGFIYFILSAVILLLFHQLERRVNCFRVA